MQLQFYVSDKVILEREIVDIDKRVTKKHRLEKVEDKILDQVVEHVQNSKAQSSTPKTAAAMAAVQAVIMAANNNPKK